jgi:hypothetical protein
MSWDCKMERIAIDIALLLPEKIKDLCVKLNKEAESQGRAYRPLGNDDFIPHITLSLGIINKKDLQEIQGIISEITNDSNNLNLEINETYTYKREDGNRSGFKIIKNPKLQRFHDKIIDKMGKYFHKDATQDMLIEGERTGLSESSKKMLERFIELYSRDKYSPHITMNIYDLEYLDFPIEFTTETVAICQVGDGCTCRKILSVHKLKG